MYYRFAIEEIVRWFNKKKYRKPLVIRGARQVGKTFLARHFCSIHNIELVEINLEEHVVHEFESTDSFDIDRALSEIYVLTGKKVTGETILFIDEIQESKYAYSRLRFFKEKKPEIAVIAAGSLLEVALKKEKQNAPVGRLDFLFLGPMTFFEFLKAHNKDALFEILNRLSLKDKLSKSVHDIVFKIVTDYFYVGGMPEAVSAFIDGDRDYFAAREIQENILETYRQDIKKYTSGKLAHVISEVFDNIAFQSGKKVKYLSLSREKSTYVKEALDILCDIFILNKVFHSNCSGLPLKTTEDRNVFKFYLIDVGIYNCFMETDFNDLNGLSGIELLNKGNIAEQFISQHLFFSSGKKKRPNLNYWLRDKIPENAEVDFVLSKKGKVFPVEVKAGKAGTIKSLIRFMYEKNQSKIAIRYDMSFRDNFKLDVNFKISDKGKLNEVNFTLFSFPLYLIEKLDDITI